MAASPPAPAPKVYNNGLHLQLGLAGFSCFCAQSSVHWVETTMVRQQLAASAEGNLFAVTAQIAKSEGFLGLYRGFSAAAIREFSYSSIRFGLYEPLKVAMGETDPRTTPFYKKVISGMLAGALASAVASPTDLLKIRMQKSTGARLSIIAHCKEIAYEGGHGFRLTNFYRGLSATIARASLLGATKMATYDQTKTLLKQHLGWREQGWERYQLQLVASVTAGLAIVFTTSPATNARTFMMASPPGTYTGLFHTLSSIVEQRGWLGLYRGFGAQWARYGPYAIVQYAVWEQARSMSGMSPL
ncbi:mitochondrial carrier domain-containing protein [Pelagophyceae sp. CCMP2097]|nr:mitochondrial carrier domain-containing protein [Pelagophyceae sp. CCMP2097]